MPASPRQQLYELSKMVQDTRITSRELRACLGKLKELREDKAVRADVEPVIAAAEDALRRKEAG